MILIVIVILALFSLSTAATLWIKREATEIAQKYETNANCEDIHQLYEPNELHDIAVAEWYNYYQSTKKHEVVSGMLSCFCESELASGADVASQMYSSPTRA